MWPFKPKQRQPQPSIIDAEKQKYAEKYWTVDRIEFMPPEEKAAYQNTAYDEFCKRLEEYLKS